MAFSGHTTPQVVINSTANANPYTGSITVGSTSDLVVLFIQGWTGSGAGDPTGWTVTLDGSAITPTDSAFTTLPFGGAIYELTGLAAGSRALSVSYPAAGRACQALAFVISGHDGGTPVAGRSIATNYASDTASLGYTRTTTRDGNIILSVLGIREHVVDTEFSFSGGTLIGSSQTGTSDTTDITCAYGYHDVATAGSVTDTYSWTDTGRCHVGFVEVNIATSSGASASASGTLPLSGSATGTAPASGQSSGVLPLSGAATGAALVAGQASGVLPLSGAGTAQSLAKAQGQGVLPLGGSATAATVPVGPGAVASGALPLGGAATAVALVMAQASGVLPLGGTATAVAPAKGLASGALPLGGSAIARAPISADAAGTMPLGGSATAQALVTAQASGSLPFAGSATAVAAPVGDIQNWRQFRRAAHWAPHGFVAGWSQINKSAHWGQRRRVAAWGDK